MYEGSVLITGSSRGLGKALAERFLLEGRVVYGCSRQGSTIDHKSYKHFLADVGDEPSVVAMLKDIAALKFPLNLLVNNAGITQASLGILTQMESAENILRTNLLGTFLVSRETLKLMQRQRYGRIVNFSSINVPLGSVGSALYNASKSGVESMAKALTRECGSADITINAIGLSLVANSGMVDTLDPKAVAGKQDALLKPKLLEIDEIMHAINFFASPLAQNISCQTMYFGGV